MFTIRRNDSFEATLAPGTPHCGMGDGQTKKFNYEAWVTIDDDGLDDDGFVIDNKEFQEYFEQQRVLRHSCEMVCRDAARHFFKRASGRGRQHIHEVCVRIWGLPEKAYAEYMWKKGNSVTGIMPERTRYSRASV
jgi:hypothetical protein